MRKLALIVLVAAFSLPIWSQTKPAQPTAARSAADDPTYVIGPEDTLSIAVWKEPDFSSTVPVRPDGKISMPLLGDIEASGKTPGQLANELTVKLKKYVEDPRVTVVVTGINSKRIYILGEVNHPGTINMSPDMTVLQAISAAGGPTAYANTKKISILRTVAGKQTKFPFNYKEVIKGNDTQQNIQLMAGDTIVVP